MGTFARLRQRLEQAAREARTTTPSPRRSRVNVSARTNIQVASNVGRPRSTEHVSAVQNAPIVQDGRSS
jgi:hypothetical protein